MRNAMPSRAILPALLSVTWCLPVVAQGGEAPKASPEAKSEKAADKPDPPPDPALPEQLARLKSMCRDRTMEQDFMAMNLVTALTETFDARNPRDKKAVITALGEVFKLGPVRPADRANLYRTVVDALSRCGEDAAPVLRKAFELDRVDDKDYASLRAEMILAVGRTKAEKQVEWLLDLALRHPEDEVVAAAGESLGNFPDLPTPKLRDLCKRLISRYGEIDMLAKTPQSTDPKAPINFGAQNAGKTLQWIQPKWNATLHKLTGESHQQAADWQRWWNKNKDWEPKGR